MGEVGISSEESLSDISREGGLLARQSRPFHPSHILSKVLQMPKETPLD